MPGILISFHTPSNAGYAMAPLERMFFEVAEEMTGHSKDVHFAFTDLSNGPPSSLPDDFENVIKIDRKKMTATDVEYISEYIRKNNIKFALCFDLQVKSVFGDLLRRSGVERIVSYWGAPISSENSFLKLMIKRVEVALRRGKPDMFIFESRAMQHLALNGRGIPERKTRIIPTGVDAQKFMPDSNANQFVAREFGIPSGKLIAFYSGHMEERKGVKVIIEAAMDLIDNRHDDEWWFLLCGNRPGEEKRFLDLMSESKAKNRVIFAGYRNDLDKIIPGCDLGIIASTGWDSFPMSSLEMASCGLPLTVSALQGLNETIENGVTGYSFEPGNSVELSTLIHKLGKENKLRKKMSQAARTRITDKYSIQIQKDNLLNALNAVFKNT